MDAPELARTAELIAERFGESHGLSRRERQVIGLTMQGLCTKEIEFLLGCSRKTIEQYWYRIYAKLGRHGREQVMAALVFWVAGNEHADLAFGRRIRPPLIAAGEDVPAVRPLSRRAGPNDA